MSMKEYHAEQVKKLESGAFDVWGHDAATCGEDGHSGNRMYLGSFYPSQVERDYFEVPYVILGGDRVVLMGSDWNA